MKDIIDKIIKPKKTKTANVDNAATKVMVESLPQDLPTEIPVYVAPKKVKVPNPWPRPLHHPVCTCHKCERWKEAEKNA